MGARVLSDDREVGKRPGERCDRSIQLGRRGCFGRRDSQRRSRASL